MSQLTRHSDIAECIAETIRSSFTDPFMLQEVTVDSYSNTAPSYGISVMPESQKEGVGNTSQDDITYSCLVVRTVHSLGNDDADRRLSFITDMRLMFHRQRLTWLGQANLYCTVDPNRVAIPEEWTKDNNSVVAVRVNTLVRESRERE